MVRRPLRVAKIGAGIGGLTLAGCPHPGGVDRDGVAAALSRHERVRRARTAAIQRASAQNTWMKNTTNADRVYRYDAWTTPLA